MPTSNANGSDRAIDREKEKVNTNSGNARFPRVSACPRRALSGKEAMRRAPVTAPTPTAVKSLFYLGESYNKERNSVKAALAYEALIQHYPQSKFAADAQTQLAAVEKEKRDPMAMLPFCGYNMGDYWGHWLAMTKRASNPPKIFRVNFFQRNERGRFLWPGFGENLRILRWIIERCKGGGQANETPIGYVPKASSLSGEGLEISKADLDQLVAVDREAWENNLKSQSDFFDTFGDHLPGGIKEEHKALASRLNS